MDENLRFCTARELPQLVLVNTEIKGSDLIITVPPPASSPTTPPTVITIPLEPSVSDLQALPLLTEVIIWGSHIDAHAVSPKADKAFSDFLGKPVRLVRLASEEEGGRIRIGSDEIIGKERLDVVSKLQDVYPYTIATMQYVLNSPSTSTRIHTSRRICYRSLNAVKSSINASKSVDRTKWPSSRVDGFAIERFRPNVVVDGPDLAPWEEDSWEHVAFCRRASSPSGEHTTTEEQFYVPGRMPRCLLTGVCPETGEADKIVPYGVLSTYRRVDPVRAATSNYPP